MEPRSGYRHVISVSRAEVLSSKTADNIFSRGEGASCRRHQVCLLVCITLRIWFQMQVSCRRRGHKWMVAMNKWQDITDTEVCQGAEEVDLRRRTIPAKTSLQRH